MPISFDTIRVGKKYYLINHGERYDFVVLSKISGQNYQLKDLHTLEQYQLEDLVRYGRGKDYDLNELA
ncbi:MAG TPA: hypothetical protein VNB90_06170 [Cytophagaceae bacterium]|nr:hypothetical protein [Cytophagaceae bacterium]